MNPENTHHTPTPAQTGTAPVNPQLAETAFVRPDTSTDAPPAGGGTPGQGWVGKTLGKYQITALLGQGAMGVVIKARDPLIERDVAIKVLAEHLAADVTALSRFLAEARAAGKVNHVNVIAIHEILQEGQMYYLVLEYVGGGSLGDKLVTHGALTVAEATRVMIDACKGVGAAHAAGVIHRDIKPANLMQSLDGAIKVADFGLAKTGADANRHFTQTGVVMGTPFFMSPEQCEAKALDQRSDVYSLGATYYSLLTGKHPFQDSESVPQLMYLHCHGPIPDPRTINASIPEACSRIVGRAMAKAPADRYQSANEMLADLQVVSATLSGQMQITLPSETGKMPAKVATGAHSSAQPPPSVKGGMKPAWIAAAMVGLAAVVALIFMFGPFKSTPPDDRKGSNTGATPAPPVVAAGEIVLGMSAPFSGATAELGRE
ncbi:MAG TPA: serine/threonine-protein kinase, partial [Gemmataceae bacterium]|nr:serine/threonine-protein kinase [Gemmataceae bacterium]